MHATPPLLLRDLIAQLLVGAVGDGCRRILLVRHFDGGSRRVVLLSLDFFALSYHSLAGLKRGNSRVR